MYTRIFRRGSRRNKEVLVKFLKDQVNIYKFKSADSLKKSQSFAIDQDLIFMRPGSSKGRKSSSLLGLGNMLDIGKSFDASLGFSTKLPNSSENFVVSNVE